MRLSLDNCGSTVRFEALELACSAVDGTAAERDGDDAVLCADCQDAVWDVWRELEKLAESARKEKGEREARAVKETVNDVMSG